MKAIVFFSFLFSLNCFAQKSDLYLFLDEDNDSRIFRSYTSDSNFEVYYLSIKKKKDAGGNELVITAKSNPLIKITYLNNKNNNLPFVIRKSKIFNSISYPNYFYIENYKSIIEMLKKSKNIYIIESKYEEDKIFYMAKKVVYEVISKL